MMLLAEKRCSPKKINNYEWIPELARAGTELAYLLIIKRSLSRPIDPIVLDLYRKS